MVTSVELAGSGTQADDSLAQLGCSARTKQKSDPSLKEPHWILMRLNLQLDVFADEPLHRRRRLPSGDAHHGLACGRAMVDVHQVHDNGRHCDASQTQEGQAQAWIYHNGGESPRGHSP